MQKLYAVNASLKKRKKTGKRKIIIRRIWASVLTLAIAVTITWASLTVCKFFFPDLFGNGISNMPFGGKLSDKI